MTLHNDVSGDIEMMEHAMTDAAAQEFLTYIKPVWLGEGTCYAVCTEDGVELAVFGTPEGAYYAARQHNLTPVRLH